MNQINTDKSNLMAVQFIEIASTLLSKDITAGHGADYITTEILMLNDTHYKLFWADLSFKLNINIYSLQTFFYSVVTQKYLITKTPVNSQVYYSSISKSIHFEQALDQILNSKSNEENKQQILKQLIKKEGKKKVIQNICAITGNSYCGKELENYLRK
ncbi:Hypothetical_protein [Hexamita inflata]|uniref:Hypothetical_protein n=1 Tax=Hexamita inflata TaxID=28002 RepID=A0AA86PAC9_9EUKA|nr:Hypothetical protein HINF_LOCUS22677 [Hexamita inflata]